MTENVKKGDFIEVEYDGRLKDPNIVFDTTRKETAEKEGITNKGATYGPVVICIGESQILKGLDDGLVGKEIGQEYSIELSPENAFGRKRGDLMKLIPASMFKKHGLRPVPGLQVNIDGAVGTVRTATGGRVIVDFNHPFAGKEISYKIKINKKIDDSTEKARCLLTLALNVKKDAIKIEEKDGKKRIDVDSTVHPELLKHVKDKLGRVLPEFKDVEMITQSADPVKKP